MFSHRQGIFEETIKIFKSRKIPQLQSGQTSPVWEDDDVSFGDRVVSHILHRIFSFCSQLHSCPNQDEALLVEWLPSHYSGALEDRKAGAEVVESTLVALRDPQEEARTWSTAPWAHTAVSAAPLGSLGEKLKPFPPLPGHLLPHRDHYWGCPVPRGHLVLQAGLCGVSCCPMLSDEHCAQAPSHDSPTCPALNTPLMNPKGSPQWGPAPQQPPMWVLELQQPGFS